ncbi:MAG: helix-turn-helix domain-containing protein [Peptoniphilaceae bacterium]
MGFSYDKLWKKLIDNKMNKTDLQKCVGITSRTIAKMGKDENVNMDTLGKLCEYFQCDIGDILEYKICGNLRKELRG